LIQNIIEEWFRERDAEVQSQGSARPGTFSSTFEILTAWFNDDDEGIIESL